MVKKDNPYGYVGKIVTKDNFIGRNDILSEIEQRLLGNNFGNMALIGLPRSGKSSIAYSLIDEGKSLHKNNIYPIWIDLSNCINSTIFYKELINNSFNTIKSLIDYKTTNQLENIYRTINKIKSISISNIETKEEIKDFFKILKTNNLRAIVVIDEFDKAQNLFNVDDFIFLRELTYNPNTTFPILTTSRRTIRDIEPEQGAISNFYGTFIVKNVGMYNSEDLNQYYSKWNKIFLNFTKIDFDYFVSEIGPHPYLLDLISFKLYGSLEGNTLSTYKSLLNKLQINVSNKRDISEFTIKFNEILENNDIHQQFISFIKIFKVDDLDQKLYQIVFGPNININKQDINKLLNYGVIVQHEDHYICFSKLLHKTLEEVKLNLPLRDVIEEYELKMREITKIWIATSYSKKSNFKNPTDWENTVGSLFKNLRALRSNSLKSYPGRASEHLIDYTQPREFWEIWNKDIEWFTKILNLDKNNLHERIMYIAKKRNPPYHQNSSFLSKTEVDLTHNYCSEMIEKISIAIKT
jgi:hypothetical protein